MAPGNGVSKSPRFAASPTVYDRLEAASRASRESLRRFRAQRLAAIRQYVGGRWGAGGADKIVPLNLVKSYCQTVGRSLVPKAPRFHFSTPHRSQKPAVDGGMSWVNRRVVEMDLATTLRRAVLDALFCVGVIKIGLATPEDAANRAWGLTAGTPFAATIDLDDLDYDVHCRDLREATYFGHRYRCPVDVVRESRRFDKNRRLAEPATDYRYNEGGDLRATALGRLDGDDLTDEFIPSVDVWEYYFPAQRRVVSFLGREGGGIDKGRALGEQEWMGPDRGPFRFLGFGTVPGSPMYAAPINDLLDLHEAANGAIRKVMRMVSRIKELSLYEGVAADDQIAVNRASDGDSVKVDNLDRMRQVVLGTQGVGPVTAGASLFKDLFNQQGGNLDLLAGRAPQSKTASQDKMLNENAHAGVSDMQETTTEFVADVGRDLLWWFWNHPTMVMRTEKTLPGLPGMSMPRAVYPRGAVDGTGRRRDLRRDVPFSQIDVRVDPYSLVHQTPQMRYTQIKGVVLELVLPLLPMLEKWGYKFDAGRFFRMVAEYTDQPDLIDLLSMGERPDPAEAGGGEQPSVGTVPTERRYVRENVSGRTDRGNELMMRNALMGVNSGGNPQQTRGGYQ